MHDQAELLKIIDRFKDASILVVGDMILDRFIWGKVSRISPEAPVPVVRVTKESSHLGGASNVIANIQALGGRTLPVGLLGLDSTADELLALLKARGVDCRGMVQVKDWQSIQKTRIIAHHQQVCRVDREAEEDLQDHHHQAILARLEELLPETPSVIVSDYGKGVITRELLQFLTEAGDDRIISVDPKDRNFDYYQNVEVLTPNQSEAERMSGVTIRNEMDLKRAAAAIFDRLHCKNLLITRGEHGMALFLSPDSLDAIPTVAREVFDVSGAGDTVIAAYTMARTVGASPSQAARLANAAAGVVVGKLGTATLSADELRNALGR